MLFPRLVCFLLILPGGLALSSAPVLAQAGKPPKLVAPKEDPNRVYDAVAEPAVPLVGYEGYSQYIDDHLNYPTSALRRGVQGTDSVQFIVEKNGTTSTFTLVKGFDAECDAEALRILKAAPRWAPARHKGQPVRQRMIIPITFALPDAPGAGKAFAADSAHLGAATRAGANAPQGATETIIRTEPTPAPSALPGGTQEVKPEAKAEPPGGTDAFFAWIQQNLRYPEAARRAKHEGKVQVEFIIEPNGTLSNVKALTPAGFGLREEAIRVIQSAPPWTPARYQGRAIKQKMVLPVIFQL